MGLTSQQFGSSWTEEKLNRVRKYLVAYTTIMSKQSFRFAYIDAFAGTGYRTLKRQQNQKELMFPEFAEQDTLQFTAGSARIALQIRPRFTKYIFIEKDESRFSELKKLKDEFPDIQDDIILINADSNGYLQDLCRNYSWRKNRAVLFLDPFGMQVRWETIEAIAETRAIDLWILFPLGVAVNRLLRRDAQINPAWRQRLNDMFGTEDWFDAFYETRASVNLFGEQVSTEKIGDFGSISRYFVNRLSQIFAGVADNPLPLYNSRGNPLYLLCFATGNPKGAKTAIKIAQDILRR
jgi:three-Cys-motif partner protein